MLAEKTFSSKNKEENKLLLISANCDYLRGPKQKSYQSRRGF
jgi:hypothetical protein